MLRNYVKIALRNLHKNRLNAGLNILGLAIGIAVALLIWVFVKSEKSYDQWLPEKERIHRVYRTWEDQRVVWTPAPLAATLADDLPEVEVGAALGEYHGRTLFQSGQQKLYVDDIAMIDTTFFQIFEFPFLHGSRLTAMDKADALVLTKSTAKRFFGDANPVGEVIRVNDESDYEVTGVIDDLPGPSHLHYRAYLPFSWTSTAWTSNNRATYVKLSPQNDAVVLAPKMTDFVNKFLIREFQDEGVQDYEDMIFDWGLQSVTDIHLDTKLYSWIGKGGGDRRMLRIFITIALIILLVAGINYVNLSTALATQRAKEVGVRKTTGASRTQLITQFLSETVVQSLLAVLLALALAQALLPYFNEIIDRELFLLGPQMHRVLVPLAAIGITVGLVAGLYPAIILSGFRPTRVLKGSFIDMSQGSLFRKVLVVSQFTLSIGLIVVMLFIYKQVQFMNESDLGFQADQVLVVPLNLPSSHRKLSAIKGSFENLAGVHSLTTSSRVPGQHAPDWGMTVQGDEETFFPHVIFTDEDYLETLDLELLEGRYLSSAFARDTVDNYVVNEAFLQTANLTPPAVGTKVKFSSADEYGQIVGVIKDYHFRPLNTSIKPLVLSSRHFRWYASFRIGTDDIAGTIADIESLWSQVEPEHPMRHSFLDEDFAKLYAEQERFGKSILYATILTIIVALLGLFGLVTFSARKRAKEIGIRKILGASVAGIVGMLSKEYLSLIVIAIVVATPISAYLMSQWLQDFAYRIDMEWWIFGVAGIATILIAFFTTSLQSIKAAMANPAESLRDE